MIALLLKLGQWITDHPKLFCVALFLAGGLLGVLAGRRLCETPSLKAEESQSTAAFGREDLTRKTEEGSSKTTTTERDYGEVMPSEPVPAADSALAKQRGSATRGVVAEAGRGPLLKEIVTVTERAGTTTQEHSERESAQSTTQTLKLSETGYSAPRWALSVGFENLLHDKALRLSVRRKFFGPIWVEGAFTPASRSVGVGAAVEF